MKPLLLALFWLIVLAVGLVGYFFSFFDEVSECKNGFDLAEVISMHLLTWVIAIWFFCRFEIVRKKP